MDIWESLIGAPPQGPEETQRIAQQLRRNAEYGLLGQLTGDRVLAPAGQGMRESSFKKAGSLQKALQEQQRRDLTKSENVLTRTLQQSLQNERIQHERGAYTPLEIGDGGEYLPTNPYTGATRDVVGKPASPKPPPGAAAYEKAVYDDVKELSKRLQPYSEVTSATKAIDRLIRPYVNKNEEGKWRAGNIPGIGRGQGLPGAQILRSEKGNEIFGRVNELRNIILQIRSGAAVTESEAVRLDAALQQLNTATDQNWLDQYIMAREQLDLAIDSIYQGFARPGVVSEYRNNPYGTPIMPVGEFGADEDALGTPWEDFGGSDG